jgi:hypothetical protein
MKKRHKNPRGDPLHHALTLGIFGSVVAAMAA